MLCALQVWAGRGSQGGRRIQEEAVWWGLGGGGSPLLSRGASSYAASLTLCCLSNRRLARIADKAFYQQPDADVIGYVYVLRAGRGGAKGRVWACPAQGGGATRQWAGRRPKALLAPLGDSEPRVPLGLRDFAGWVPGHPRRARKPPQSGQREAAARHLAPNPAT